MDSADLVGIVSDIMRIKSVKMKAVKSLNASYNILENADTMTNCKFGLQVLTWKKK